MNELIKRVSTLRVARGVCTIRQESEKGEKLDDVKPWKQGKERDSNRSC